MSTEPQSCQEESQNPARALWGRKWFWPILEELDAFEQSNDDCKPVDDALSDESPEFMFQAIWKCGTAMASYNGLVKPEQLNSRSVGVMIGAHWSFCDAAARSYQIWQAFTPAQIREIDGAWYPGFCRDCTKAAKKYFEEWTPRFQEIKSRAAALAASQGSFDEIDYMQGYLKGLQFIDRIREKMKPTKIKRLKDEQARNCVYLFAVCCGREIEANKADLSWPELHQAFKEFFDFKVDIDEDAFKQILVRTTLKGVGKAGRRVPIQIVTPKD